RLLVRSSPCTRSRSNSHRRTIYPVLENPKGSGAAPLAQLFQRFEPEHASEASAETEQEIFGVQRREVEELLCEWHEQHDSQERRGAADDPAKRDIGNAQHRDDRSRP